jgi:hypothetical protein
MAESLVPGVSLPYELWNNIFLFVIDLDDNTHAKYAPGTELTGLLRVSRSWEVSTAVQIGVRECALNPTLQLIAGPLV